jgi:hypothetical protein
MFRVEWLRVAVGELAELWIEADSPFRQAITEATHALDQELQADPFRASDSREGEVRISFSAVVQHASLSAVGPMADQHQNQDQLPQRCLGHLQIKQNVFAW